MRIYGLDFSGLEQDLMRECGHGKSSRFDKSRGPFKFANVVTFLAFTLEVPVSNHGYPD